MLILRPSQKKIDGGKPNGDKSYTESYQSHKDCSDGYKFVFCYNDKYSKPVPNFRGQDTVYKFIENMIDELEWCQDNFKAEIIITTEDKSNFKTSKKCHICNKKYTEKDIRVKDHCQVTEKYRN